MVTSASPALFGHIASSYSTPGSKADQPRDLNFLETASTFVRRTRAVIKAILQNDESRRIYYFLCLNFSYMGVQMAWGIWTNSLGLISDCASRFAGSDHQLTCLPAIHMFFDNAALALGLFASVMSTWPSDQVFTYGYSRVETLSGFANGLFLILISIFIVFEAIQRLMDPPEMNTNQLLTVSALGLAVNLVGLVATGGHHHHGHSHGVS
jgi:zinc transporter 5/7